MKPISIINRSHHPLPSYATDQAAGMDLRAYLEEPVTIQPQERKLIPTGLYMALPEGMEAQIRPRSGLAFREGITLLNSPGTIDADYRGELKIILVNLSKNPFVLKDGDRIAQLIIAPYVQASWRLVEKLPKTIRSVKGFGSTGIE